MQLEAERAVALVATAGVACAGCWTGYRLLATASPILDAACALCAFAVVGALLGGSLLGAALALPASGVRLLGLGAAWDDSLVVRWAALLLRMHELRAAGVSLLDIQAVLLVALLALVGMRLLHHAVVALRLLKVARRNQTLILRAPLASAKG